MRREVEKTVEQAKNGYMISAILKQSQRFTKQSKDVIRDIEATLDKIEGAAIGDYYDS